MSSSASPWGIPSAAASGSATSLMVDGTPKDTSGCLNTISASRTFSVPTSYRVPASTPTTTVSELTSLMLIVEGSMSTNKWHEWKGGCLGRAGEVNSLGTSLQFRKGKRRAFPPRWTQSRYHGSVRQVRSSSPVISKAASSFPANTLWVVRLSKMLAGVALQLKGMNQRRSAQYGLMIGRW